MERTLLERLADMAAVVDGSQEQLFRDAAVEIMRLQERERDALEVIAAFEEPDGFNGWHDKYSQAITKARRFIDGD